MQHEGVRYDAKKGHSPADTVSNRHSSLAFAPQYQRMQLVTFSRSLGPGTRAFVSPGHDIDRIFA